MRMSEEKISHAKAQRRKALPRFKVCSLRLCAFTPLRLCGFTFAPLREKNLSASR